MVIGSTIPISEPSQLVTLVDATWIIFVLCLDPRQRHYHYLLHFQPRTVWLIE